MSTPPPTYETLIDYATMKAARKLALRSRLRRATLRGRQTASTRRRALALSALTLLGLAASTNVKGQAPPKQPEVTPLARAPWLERTFRDEEESPEMLLAELPLQTGDTVLDFGCGTGYYARRLARLVGSLGTIICADIQPGMLAIASTLAEAEHLVLLCQTA